MTIAALAAFVALLLALAMVRRDRQQVIARLWKFDDWLLFLRR
jgi:hypothetical protein